ncbi:hypothetical protein IB279_28995 [Ensifer sp. ENS06]|nr:hypothetical protein [Ensifer sp. ENS06]
MHETRASGAFCKPELNLENEALTTNPNSSEMIALSLVRFERVASIALVVRPS